MYRFKIVSVGSYNDITKHFHDVLNVNSNNEHLRENFCARETLN